MTDNCPRYVDVPGSELAAIGSRGAKKNNERASRKVRVHHRHSPISIFESAFRDLMSVTDLPLTSVNT